ncbi:nuclear protein DGCR14 [Xylariaceae sp. FL1019]|nr:nuclear protein DGCR14 [Xylariaceae sp. FL1019]
MESDHSESKALTLKRSADLSLMPPPPAPKRIKRPKKVIDEDSYTEALSHIIARDFFPGLLESETQQEYLDALESNDTAWISSASRRLQHVMTPGRRKTRRGVSLTPAFQTPRDFRGDTPVSAADTPTESSAGKEKPDIDMNMSLSAFQQRYTSEDNESFYQLLDAQNSKRAEKYAWLWTGNKLPSKAQIAQKKVEQKLIDSGHNLTDDGYRKKDRLAIKDRDDRPAQPDTWKTLPNNALMFAPEGIEDNLQTVAQRAEDNSRAPPKGVNYANTRLPAPKITDDDLPPSSRATSPTLSAVRDAIAGRRRADTVSTTVGSETPRVNGYAFVDDVEPEPESLPAIKIDLGPGDLTPNPFVLQQQSRREALHHRMVDRIAESKRSASKHGSGGSVTGTPIPRFPSSPRVVGDMTPAAQRLLSSMGGGKTPKTPFGVSRVGVTPKGTPRRLKQLGLK